MNHPDPQLDRRERQARLAVLWTSFAGFSSMFAVWMMFGVLGLPIRDEFGLSNVQFGWLVAVAIINGAIWRLLFGLLADRYGGRRVFIANLLAAAVPAFLVARAASYEELLVYAFLVGLAGNSFAVGSAWNAAWFPREQQGFAMGLFGAGNVGASLTKFIGPALIAAVPAAGFLGGVIPGGWRFVPFLYGVLLVAMALATWALTPRTDRKPAAGRTIGQMLAPLREVRVWRFSLYYVVVFGAYVALASWLPKYYVDVYGLPLASAALLTTPFIFASSLLRPFGGWLADQYGPRKVTYWVFAATILATAALLLPVGLAAFSALVLAVGVAQGIGKASTIKYIPEYYPKDVGVVVGLVGALGAVGGFFMPPLFAYLTELTGRPQAVFGVILAVTGVSLAWLHAVVLGLRRTSRLEALEAGHAG